MGGFLRLLAIFVTIEPLYGQLTTLTGTGASQTLTGDDVLPTGTQVTYLTFNSTITLSSTTSTNTSLSTSIISGGFTASNSTTKSSATKTSSSATPSNTQPCNNHVEFCTRKYSNITMVTAHNFPFVKKGNAASNQEYGVIDQLNDGIRMLQGQTHFVNNTLYFCHTSCDLLNAGTVESQFSTIAKWVKDHPYDIVTILIGNGDFIGVGNFTSPIQNSGLGKWLYTPTIVPMALDSWPTLSEMILKNTRVVMFMDYNADQTKVPYILDEFSQMWETPFSPTDTTFPCNQQRPPNLSDADAKQRMYMANHNLNVPASLFGSTILVPNTATINQTNSISGNSSLGAMVDTCKASWDRPPNFLLVDYYNTGNYPGSVFEVAASANGVNYTGKCCGGTTSSASVMKIDFGKFWICSMLGLSFVIASLV